MLNKFSSRIHEDPIAINNWTLSQCLEAQHKYLRWIEHFPTHADKDVKKHIYTTYLLPRIDQLQREKEIEDALNPPPTLMELQERKHA